MNIFMKKRLSPGEKQNEQRRQLLNEVETQKILLNATKQDVEKKQELEELRREVQANKESLRDMEIANARKQHPLLAKIGDIERELGQKAYAQGSKFAANIGRQAMRGLRTRKRKSRSSSFSFGFGGFY